MGLVAILAAVALLMIVFRDLGYRDGVRDGRKFERTWWIGQEQAAEEAQKEIWRENPLSGKGKWDRWP